MFTPRVVAFAIVSLVFASLRSVALASYAASTLLLDDGTDRNFVFSLNIPYNSPNNDLYFHLSGSAGYSWLAVGCGSQMKGSLIFSVYTSTEKDNVTASVRLANGHREPEYDSSVKLDVLDGTGLKGDAYVLNARCRNCRKWAGGSIDLTSSGQSWIYAFGPNENLVSASPSAMMRRHNAYGHFRMDMRRAQGDAGVPTAGNLTTMFGATLDGRLKRDHDVGTPLHALFMAGTFVILFPLGVLFVAILGRVKLHLIMQTTGMVAITCGFLIGIYESTVQVRTRRARQPHQVIGILTWCFALAQTVGGYIQHRQYKSTGVKSPFSKVHRIAGLLIICLGIINGGLGFKLASDSPVTDHGSLYGIIIAVLVFLVVGAYLWRNRYRVRRDPQTSPAALNFQRGLAEQQNTNIRSDQEQGVALGDVPGGPPPPAYSRS
ncbi:MAG: hypothetical protein M1814_004872 [Vezdaea aestivalis]|nr:MAG: hypothetical protein M1814_004872 [Vezdaea aestivalis]